jgi:hypothetical protein
VKSILGLFHGSLKNISSAVDDVSYFSVNMISFLNLGSYNLVIPGDIDFQDRSTGNAKLLDA